MKLPLDLNKPAPSRYESMVEGALAVAIILTVITALVLL